jgi:hypothetical protein
MINKTFFTRFASVLGGLLLTLTAHANLIVNGSFEDNSVALGNWAYFDSASVNGWEGSNLEIWNNFGGVTAPDGKQHAELNAHPYTGNVFSIFQTFNTVVGQSYDVSFFYSARESANEAFSFSVGTLSTLINDHVVGAWSQYANSFVANSTSTTLRFTSVDTGTIGNFLDNVVVTTKANVIESNPLVMLMIGLAGLILVRRKNRAHE